MWVGLNPATNGLKVHALPTQATKLVNGFLLSLCGDTSYCSGGLGETRTRNQRIKKSAALPTELPTQRRCIIWIQNYLSALWVLLPLISRLKLTATEPGYIFCTASSTGLFAQAQHHPTASKPTPPSSNGPKAGLRQCRWPTRPSQDAASAQPAVTAACPSSARRAVGRYQRGVRQCAGAIPCRQLQPGGGSPWATKIDVGGPVLATQTLRRARHRGCRRGCPAATSSSGRCQRPATPAWRHSVAAAVACRALPAVVRRGRDRLGRQQQARAAVANCNACSG